MSNYENIETFGGVPIKAWTTGLDVEEQAKAQLRNVALLPIIHKWLAVMPDVHLGMGATIGSVIPTIDAVIPAAVGVDIGCGMMAVETTLTAEDLPDDLSKMRNTIERAAPHGWGRRGGSWKSLPSLAEKAWKKMDAGYVAITKKYDALDKANPAAQLGTLGGGNHFIEVCLDERNKVWVMLHSGSRGVGNRIGQFFISLARKEMERLDRRLPDRDLSYLREGTDSFDDYVFAVEWAQNYARSNRDIMMQHILDSLHKLKGLPPFKTGLMAVNCHHNYVARETHYGDEVLVTRKGAVRAQIGDYGIIPGSMGAKSFIVRGLGNPESFNSCSHGAGRVMSRTQAKKNFTVDDHIAATEGVECKKDRSVLDETPGAYKDIDKVMAAQKDLVEVVHTLKQVVCVKG